ncbi:MAG: hypothetical protein ACK2T7_06965, partial [Anaerolineales bacterium]
CMSRNDLNGLLLGRGRRRRVVGQDIGDDRLDILTFLVGDRALGVISVQSETTPDLYGRHNLDLLTTIASQAAVAINNTRLFQSEQDRALQERTVRTITDKVRRGTDTRAIMRIALEELSQVLNADMSTIQLGKPEEIMQEESEPALDEEITEG